MRTPRAGSCSTSTPSSSGSGSWTRERLPVGHVAARIDDEPVQPRRELRLAAELAEPDAELRERLLRGVARVLGVAQQMAREPLDARRVASAQRLERGGVAVLRAGDEDRVAEARVVEAARLRAAVGGLPSRQP